LRQVGGGTGFFIQPDGHLLTNNHVASQCEALSVEAADGTEALARLEAASPADDLALLQTGLSIPQVAVFEENVSLDGRPAAVIGYPSHGLQRITPTLVWGSLAGPMTHDGHRFAFAADVHPGNSGGPIVDQRGLVVGVVFAKINAVAVFQNTGRSADQIGFGINNETTLAFLASHGVTVATAGRGPKLADDSLFAQSRPFIARVLCWRSQGAPQK
jgi:S1-C subfamily serine protease